MPETSQHEEKLVSRNLIIRTRDDVDGKLPYADTDVDQYLRATAGPLARRWIKECMTNHDSCQKEARISSIFCTDNCHYIIDLEGNPSRLLEITTNNDPSLGAEERIRIVNPEFSTEQIEYIALSHRWGHDDVLKTTEASRSEMARNGMRVSELPRTFKEAVQLTQEMGYSHLWIDSLCIVQDDEEDWHREARRMALIFSKAVCVIEAVYGTGSDSGLVTMNPSHKDSENLNTRAWVLQEQMLPPRSLKFESGLILWECRECDASDARPDMAKRESNPSEAYPTHPKDIFAFFRDWRVPSKDSVHEEGSEPDGQVPGAGDGASSTTTEDSLPEEIEPNVSGPYYDRERRVVVMQYGDDLPGHRENFNNYVAFNRISSAQTTMRVFPEDGSEPFGKFWHLVGDLTRPREDYNIFLTVWWQFISIYTKRHLTYDSDRFLAINGITSVAQRWTQLRNTFGLWWHFLEQELCWYVDPLETPANRPEAWLGPSWSWMSTCNGCIKNDVYAHLPSPGQLSLKPYITQPVGTSFDMPLPLRAWTKAKYHSIEVKGPLRKATITATLDGHGKLRYEVALPPVGRRSDHETCDFRPDCASEFPLERPINVYCLHIRQYDAKDLDLPQYIDLYLVLRQLNGETEIQFHDEEIDRDDLLEERTMSRYGYMEVTYGRDDMRNWDDIYEDLWWWWVRLV